MKTWTLFLTLILLSIKLSGQFTTDELRQIRKDQIKAIYCDSMLLNRAQRIELQNRQINALNQSILNYQDKEVIHQDKEIYYRDLLRQRDIKIDKLAKRNKTFKIGCVTLGVSTVVMFGVLMIGR